MTEALQYLWLNVQVQFFKDLRYYFASCSFVPKQALKATQIYINVLNFFFNSYDLTEPNFGHVEVDRNSAQESSRIPVRFMHVLDAV